MSVQSHGKSMNSPALTSKSVLRFLGFDFLTAAGKKKQTNIKAKSSQRKPKSYLIISNQSRSDNFPEHSNGMLKEIVYLSSFNLTLPLRSPEQIHNYHFHGVLCSQLILIKQIRLSFEMHGGAWDKPCYFPVPPWDPSCCSLHFYALLLTLQKTLLWFLNTPLCFRE